MNQAIIIIFIRYEALVLLIFYSLYIGLMYFNRRLDTLLNAWCLSHRHICPRVIHDDVSSVEIAAQSSGKFGGKHDGETVGLNSADTVMANYSRLEADESEAAIHLNQHEIPTGKTHLQVRLKYNIFWELKRIIVRVKMAFS